MGFFMDRQALIQKAESLGIDINKYWPTSKIQTLVDLQENESAESVAL